MQPVPCWEKLWVAPSGSSSFKVYKWVKTEKIQVSLCLNLHMWNSGDLGFSVKQFDDEENEVDEPLAPLPDEPEGVEGDEDDQDEARNEPTQVKDVDMDANQDRPSEVPPSPKPQLILIQSNSELDMTTNDDDGLNNDPSLKLDATIGGHEGKKDDGLELDMSGLGPDGLQLASAHDLAQLDPQDGLMGGPLMDQTADPFAQPT